MTEAYIPGERAIAGVAVPLKLSSNESPHGPGARALEAYARAAAELLRYPSSSQGELRRAVAEVHGLDPARLVFGNGSDEVIQMLTRAYVGPGDEVILSEHCFLMAKVHALAQGAKLQVAPSRTTTPAWTRSLKSSPRAPAWWRLPLRTIPAAGTCRTRS